MERSKCSNCVAGMDIEIGLSMILLEIEVYLRGWLDNDKGDRDGIPSPPVVYNRGRSLVHSSTHQIRLTDDNNSRVSKTVL